MCADNLSVLKFISRPSRCRRTFGFLLRCRPLSYSTFKAEDRVRDLAKAGVIGQEGLFPTFISPGGTGDSQWMSMGKKRKKKKEKTRQPARQLGKCGTPRTWITDRRCASLSLSLSLLLRGISSRFNRPFPDFSWDRGRREGSICQRKIRERMKTRQRWSAARNEKEKRKEERGRSPRY